MMTVGANVKNVYYTMKHIEAGFRELILKTNDEAMKLTLQEANETIREVKEDLHKQVQFLMNEEPQY